MIRLGYIALAATVLVLAPASEAQAQRRGTRPAYIVPLTAAQGAELNAEIGRLSRRLGIRESVLEAIANILGTNLRNATFSELIQRIRSQAERAAELQARLESLERQIAALSDAALRTPAERAIDRARAAFDEGRLEVADREFASLERFRYSELEAVREAWVEAVEARARIAELRLDFDGAEALRLSALRDEQRQSVLRQWRLAMSAGSSRYQQSLLFGSETAAARAIFIYRNEALRLVSRDEHPGLWAGTQQELGMSLLYLGGLRDDVQLYRDALAAFEAASALFPQEEFPDIWSELQELIGRSLVVIGEEEESPVILQQAISAFRASERVRVQLNDHSGRGFVRKSLSDAYIVLGELTGRADFAQQGIAELRILLSEFPRDENPAAWEDIQSSLGPALMSLYSLNGERATIDEAIGESRISLAAVSRDVEPYVWAARQLALASSLITSVQGVEDRGRFDEGFRLICEVRSVDQFEGPRMREVLERVLPRLIEAARELEARTGERWTSRNCLG